MIWVLRAGKSAKSILAMAAQGADVPELRDRQDIAGLGWLLTAFFDLHTTRQVTFGGALPISWSAIESYSEAERMTDTERYVLHQVTVALDEIWLKWVERRSQPEKSKS